MSRMSEMYIQILVDPFPPEHPKHASQLYQSTCWDGESTPNDRESWLAIRNAVAISITQAVSDPELAFNHRFDLLTILNDVSHCDYVLDLQVCMTNIHRAYTGLRMFGRK